MDEAINWHKKASAFGKNDKYMFVKHNSWSKILYYLSVLDFSSKNYYKIWI